MWSPICEIILLNFDMVDGNSIADDLRASSSNYRKNMNHRKDDAYLLRVVLKCVRRSQKGETYCRIKKPIRCRFNSVASYAHWDYITSKLEGMGFIYSTPCRGNKHIRTVCWL